MMNQKLNTAQGRKKCKINDRVDWQQNEFY